MTKTNAGRRASFSPAQVAGVKEFWSAIISMVQADPGLRSATERVEAESAELESFLEAMRAEANDESGGLASDDQQALEDIVGELRALDASAVALQRRMSSAAEDLLKDQSVRHCLLCQPGRVESLPAQLGLVFAELYGILEVELPPKERDNLPVSLVVNWADSGAECHWQPNPAQVMDFAQLVFESVLRGGEFDRASAREITRVILKEIRSGKLIPPRFARNRSSSQQQTVLDLQPPRDEVPAIAPEAIISKTQMHAVELEEGLPPELLGLLQSVRVMVAVLNASPPRDVLAEVRSMSGRRAQVEPEKDASLAELVAAETAARLEIPVEIAHQLLLPWRAQAGALSELRSLLGEIVKITDLGPSGRV